MPDRLQTLLELINEWEKQQSQRVKDRITFLKTMMKNHDSSKMIEQKLTDAAVDKLGDYL
jgi:hypothetical protein